MPAIQPATIAYRISEQIRERVPHLTEFLSPKDFSVLRWQDEIAKLSNVEPGRGALCKAYVAHMLGDIASVERHLSDALYRDIPTEVILDARLTAFSNLLFASKALNVFRTGVDIKYQNIGTHINSTFISGSFQYALHLMSQAEHAGLDLLKEGASSMLPDIAHVLKDQNVSDDDCAKVLDAAGEVMRSRRLFWQESEPRYILNKKAGTVGVRFRVRVSPAEASEMTVQTADKLIELDLDTLPFFVSFVGTKS